MSYSKAFFAFCLSFLGGIFLNSFFKIPQPTVLIFLILGLILIVVRRYKKLVIICLCILFLFLGIWQHRNAELRIINDELRKFNDYQESVTLSGIVIKEPDIRERNVKLTIKTDTINLKYTENDIQVISGKVLITTSKYPGYEYGDRLEIIGKLKTPEEFPDFNYKDYLAKDGINSAMYYSKIELIEKNQGNFAYAKILSFKNKLREVVYSSLLPPQSSILGAIILGDKRGISDEWKNKLNITGVRHITAVSGMHIVILMNCLTSLLILLGFYRGQAFYFTLILITLFILMTGCQSSAIRAGIMGGLLLLGQHFGRIGASFRAIIFSAAIMLAINPLLLRYDVGFQLSFLAVIGIIYLGHILKNWLKFIPERKFLNTKNILVMTFSAQIFTLPILVYNFGKVSLISPITNVLILPTIYWIMLFGFIFAISGVILQPLSWILSLPVFVLLTYLTKIVDLFSKIPGAAQNLEISWIWLIIFYLILGLITYRVNKKFNQPIFLR